jgi:cyclophilin family peptidyl-prolyl cis-trans isomerase
MKFKIAFVFLLIILAFNYSKAQSKVDTVVTISTKYGDMKLLLSEKTPRHRRNFIKLAKEGAYDSVTFHRIIQNFMIQGGDPGTSNLKKAPIAEYLLDAEIDSSLFHKKGALAAARTDNPAKASSGFQFYIVQGHKFTDQQLDMLVQKTGKTMSNPHKEAYKTIGGTPHLDKEYTVFGELIEGFDVLDKIAAVQAGQGGMPNQPVRFTVKVDRVKKKEISKKYNYSYPQN